jgi:hypothetical protein
MRLTAGLLTLLWAFTSVQASAQQTATLRGSINAKATVSPAAQALTAYGGGVTASLARAGDERINIHLTGTPESNNNVFIARLLLRTNAAYELQSFLFSSSGTPPINASVTAVRPTGSAVVAGAIEGIRSPQSQINLSTSPSVLVTGPRISRGNASLSTNAIEIELRFEATAAMTDNWTADVAVIIYAQ